jgi:glutathione peroxidase-family protein
MKLLILLKIMIFSLAATASEIYDFKLQTTAGKEVNFKEYKNKSIMIVNIATRCGYTKQLDGLEKLYKENKDKGLVIIGVPSNDFGGQTPENNKDVAKFCKLNYGVTFPLMKKEVITGDKKSDLYKYLVSKTDNKEIQWNFTKFLFDKKGKLVKRYSSGVAPESPELLKDLKKTL